MILNTEQVVPALYKVATQIPRGLAHDVHPNVMPAVKPRTSEIDYKKKK